MIAAASLKGGFHFALRLRGGRSAGTDEVAEFCGLVAQAAAVKTRIVPVQMGATPLLACVLREELHAGASPPLVVFEGDILAQPDLAKERDYDDLDDFLCEVPTDTSPEVADAARHLSGLRCTYVWLLPAGTEPPPMWRGLLSACVGPLVTDFEWSRGVLAREAQGLEGKAIDEALLRVRDPRDARASARFAVRVAAADVGVQLEEGFVLAARSFAPQSDNIVPRVRTLTYETRLFVSDHDDDDLLSHADRLARGGARILLVGPPGGGKSAWAMEFARRAGRPVETLEGARFLACRLGSLERNLARLMCAAVRSGAILWADEIDSICGVRTGEGGGNAVLVRTLTNEMLRHLDATAGELPMLAAANDADAIDPSVRRRFDIVVTVSANLPEDREPIAWVAILGMEMPEGMEAIGSTCVSDYALAASRCKLLGRLDAVFAADAVRRARDARLGQGGVRRYGFVGRWSGGNDA
jgi:hypothetical protein